MSANVKQSWPTRLPTPSNFSLRATNGPAGGGVLRSHSGHLCANVTATNSSEPPVTRTAPANALFGGCPNCSCAILMMDENLEIGTTPAGGYQSSTSIRFLTLTSKTSRPSFQYNFAKKSQLAITSAKTRTNQICTPPVQPTTRHAHAFGGIFVTTTVRTPECCFGCANISNMACQPPDTATKSVNNATIR